MALRPRLLLVGDEPTLLQTRRMILGNRFAVYASARVSEAMNMVREHTFELIVVCRSTEYWSQFAELASTQIPAPKIVAITTMEAETPKWADAAVCSTRGPYELLRVCAGMFGMMTKAKSDNLSIRPSKKPVPTAIG